MTAPEILSADVVLVGAGLLSNPGDFDKFAAAVESEVVRTGGGFMMSRSGDAPMPSENLSIARDRITLELSSNRSVIRREYPSKEDLNRFADVAGYAIRHTTTTIADLKAIGYNLTMVYSLDSEMHAISYLGERLFSKSLPVPGGWQLLGGFGNLVFADSDNRFWTFTIEPRFRDRITNRIFLNVNCHLDKPELPSACEIRETQGYLWNVVSQFVMDFGTMDGDAHD